MTFNFNWDIVFSIFPVQVFLETKGFNAEIYVRIIILSIYFSQ